MNHDNERKAFEAWFESRYDAHFMQFALDLDLYVDKHTQTCWEAWLSSANREGYKLVPVEPKFETMQEMNVAIIENISETPKYRMQQVYKAMIEAQEQSHD